LTPTAALRVFVTTTQRPGACAKYLNQDYLETLIRHKTPLT
jgi:hypothetical protein